MDDLVVMGYMVKKIDEANPDGKIVSRVYHAKSAAEEFAKLATQAAHGRATFFVTERLGRDWV